MRAPAVMIREDTPGISPSAGRRSKRRGDLAAHVLGRFPGQACFKGSSSLSSPDSAQRPGRVAANHFLAVLQGLLDNRHVIRVATITQRNRRIPLEEALLPDVV